jgi:hypothetical protein
LERDEARDLYVGLSSYECAGMAIMERVLSHITRLSLTAQFSTFAACERSESERMQLALDFVCPRLYSALGIAEDDVAVRLCIVMRPDGATVDPKEYVLHWPQVAMQRADLSARWCAELMQEDPHFAATLTLPQATLFFFVSSAACRRAAEHAHILPHVRVHRRAATRAACLGGAQACSHRVGGSRPAGVRWHRATVVGRWGLSLRVGPPAAGGGIPGRRPPPRWAAATPRAPGRGSRTT